MLTVNHSAFWALWLYMNLAIYRMFSEHEIKHTDTHIHKANTHMINAVHTLRV